MSQFYQTKKQDYILQLAQRIVGATTTQEFTAVISEAYLFLTKQEWNCFVAECWRLKEQSKQREST